MDALSTFAYKIDRINEKQSSELIPFFVYYLQFDKGLSSVTAVDINSCFTQLSIKPYSNISAYLSAHIRGTPPIFLKQSKGYILSRQKKEEIEIILSIPKEIPISVGNIINLEIFKDTPYYITHTAEQLAQCYECGLYDASLVMIRRLIETLIIECFERHNIDNVIKDSSGDFLSLRDLIEKHLNSPKWNCSRNFNKNIVLIKKLGDLSAHNRRFIAKKNDIEGLKQEIRQVIQEVILLIDYPHWTK